MHNNNEETNEIAIDVSLCLYKRQIDNFKALNTNIKLFKVQRKTAHLLPSDGHL